MKEAFYNQLQIRKNSGSYRGPLLSREEYRELICQVKCAKEAVQRCKEHSKLLKKYDIHEVDGTEKLIVPLTKTGPNNMKYYVHDEELYDILLEVHHSFDHGPYAEIKRELRSKYRNITREDIKLFLSYCDYCLKRPKIKRMGTVPKFSEFKGMSSRGQVDLIDYQSQPDGKFKFVMVYHDCLTKYCILKPLKTGSPLEIANSLADVFLLIGAPAILQSCEDQEFIMEVVRNLKVVWSEPKIVYGKRSLSPQILKRTASDIINWMRDNKSPKWSEGLRYIQFMRNKLYCFQTGKSPFEAFFGRFPQFGLGTSKLPANVVADIDTEEQLEEYLTRTSYKQTKGICIINHSDNSSSVKLSDEAVSNTFPERIGRNSNQSGLSNENVVHTSDSSTPQAIHDDGIRPLYTGSDKSPCKYSKIILQQKDVKIDGDSEVDLEGQNLQNMKQAFESRSTDSSDDEPVLISYRPLDGNMSFATEADFNLNRRLNLSTQYTPMEGRETRTLLIYNLPLSINRIHLKSLLEQFGKIERLSLKWRPNQCEPAWVYCSVRFEKIENAVKALELNGVEYEGCCLRVKILRHIGRNFLNRTIVVRNIPLSADENALHSLFINYGPIRSVTLVGSGISEEFAGVGLVAFQLIASVESFRKKKSIQFGDHMLQISRVGRKQLNKFETQIIRTRLFLGQLPIPSSAVANKNDDETLTSADISIQETPGMF